MNRIGCWLKQMVQRDSITLLFGLFLAIILILSTGTKCSALQIDRCVLKSGSHDCVAWKDDLVVLKSNAKHDSRNIINTQTEVRQASEFDMLQAKYKVMKDHFVKKDSVKLVSCDFEGCN